MRNFYEPALRYATTVGDAVLAALCPRSGRVRRLACEVLAVLFAIYRSEKDVNPMILDEEWAGLVELLHDFKETPCAPCPGKSCAYKYGTAWSPVKIEGPRADANVREITAAVFDLDNLTHEQLVAVAQRLEGFEYVVHSTHSHRPPNANCLRVVMPLTRPVPAADWRRCLAAAVKHLGLPADPACTDLSRIYFLPTVATGGPRLIAHGTGKALDVDFLLATHAADESLAQDSVEQRPLRDEATIAADAEADEVTIVAAEAGEVLDYGDLRECLAALRRSYAHSKRQGAQERYALIDRLLKGEPLAPIGERDKSVNKVASILACALPVDTPVEAAIELMRASIGGMPHDDADPGDSLGYWLGKARKSYLRAMKRRKDRERELSELRESIRRRLAGHRDAPPVLLAAAAPAPGRPAIEIVPAGAASVAEPDWMRGLISNADGTYKNCGHNIGLILQHADEVRGTLRFNELRKEIDVFGGPFANEPKQTLHVGVANWFQSQLGINAKPHEVKEQIARVARLNAYDPLAEYLRGLVWDRVPRLEGVLETYFGARTHDAEGNDITKYLRLVGPKWFISAAARALRPGSKVDTVLVLEGKQGIKKSTAFAVLGGPFFCDTALKIGDKDSTMIAARSWIIELAELAAMKRSETESQKAFLTRRVDAIRPPYGHVIEEFPRRAVFAGTTNEQEGYLVDATGNRRFWPVYVEKIDIEALARDRDQLWAEAVVLFEQGVEWWLDGDEAKLAEAQADERYTESPLVEQIADWFYGLAPLKRPKAVGTHDVAGVVLMMPADRVTRAVEGEIGRALQRLGFTRARRRVYGRPTWVYIPSDDMLKAPQGVAAHLRLIANAPAPAETVAEKGQ